jgi:predicted RND superfamily exporter protein
MERVIRWILNRPIVVIVAIFLPTLYFGWHLPQVEVNNNVVAMFPKNDPDLLYYQDFYKEFGNEEFIAVYFQCDDVFDLRILRMIDRMTKRFQELPDVDQVLSVTNFQSTYNQGDVLVLGALENELSTLQPSNMEGVRQRILSDPLYHKAVLVSKDGKAAHIAILLKKLFHMKDTEQVVQQVRKIMKEEEQRENIPITMGGTPFYLAEVQKAYERDNWVMTPILLLVVFIVLWIIFRSLWLPLAPLVVTGFSTIWTFGLIVVTGRFVTALTEILLPLLLVYGVLNSVHLLTAYRQRFRAEKSSRETISETISSIALPCFWASATTAIGFLSLMTSSVSVIREFGWYSAFGVMVSYLFTFTLLPMALDRWGWIPSEKIERKGSFVKEFVVVLVDLANRYRGSVLVGGMVLTLLFGFWSTRTIVDTNYLSLFRDDAEITQAERLASRLFGSWSPLEFSIRYRGGESILEYSVLKQVEEIQGYLESLPSIDKSLSVADVLKKTNQELHGGDPNFYTIPQDKMAIERLALFVGDTGGKHGLSSYLSSDWTRMRLTARTFILPSKELVALFDKIEKHIQKEIDPRLEIQITGDATLDHKLTVKILDTEIQSFSMAFLLIFIVMIFALRSWKLALIAIPANLFPVAVMLGTMGKTGVSLNIGTCTIASVLISMAVDDTIHFLHRFKEELAEKKDYGAALKSTMEIVGSPIVYTSFVLAAGFWVLVFSSFVPAIHFGLLSGIGVIAALVGDIIILPALLMSSKPIRVNSAEALKVKENVATEG